MYPDKNRSLVASLDWWTILLYFVLILWGWLSICGATYSFDMDELFRWGSRPIMQLVWAALGALIACSVLILNPRIFEDGAPIFYLAMMGLLMITIVVAPDIKGSRSWLVMGPVRLQPAEFAKIATALLLSWQISKHDFRIASIKSYCIIFGMVFFPVLLILGQKETGSALVFFALFLALYREGFSGLFLGLGLSAAVYFVSALILDGVFWWREMTRADLFFVCNAIFYFTLALAHQYLKPYRAYLYLWAVVALLIQGIAILVSTQIHPFDISLLSCVLLGALMLYFLYIAVKDYLLRALAVMVFALGSLGFYFSTGYVFDQVLEPHQQVRIKVTLGIEEDLRGKGYNVDQSKIAIGSGGLWGKGFLQGTQTKLNYVPEQDTDFIFCTVGEELGFVGSSLLLILYAVFILRIVALAERQTLLFARVYGYCVASILLFHLFINVGMVMGLLPVIGIPLPFFSYGGSSLWGFSFMLFILLSFDARRENKNI